MSGAVMGEIIAVVDSEGVGVSVVVGIIAPVVEVGVGAQADKVVVAVVDDTKALHFLADDPVKQTQFFLTSTPAPWHEDTAFESVMAMPLKVISSICPPLEVVSANGPAIYARL